MYLSYVYHVRNKITNEYYYGSRYKNVSLNLSPEDDLWIKYFTSSKRVKNLIKEYGKESFYYEIILKNEDYNICYHYEQDIISQHLDNPLCLNSYCRITGKFSMAGVTLSEETKAKMSAAKKGKPSWNKGLLKSEEEKSHQSKIMKGKVSWNKNIPMSEDTKEKLSLIMLQKPGNPRSDETKAKISKSLTGRVYSEESKLKMRKERSQETKDKMKASALARWAKIKDIRE